LDNRYASAYASGWTVNLILWHG